MGGRMEHFERYAIYYAPKAGPLADFAAGWLGWDPAAGMARAHPVIAGLPHTVDEITATPRKYGFHGTIKPPFRLADDSGRAGLEGDLTALAARLAPVVMDGLALHRLGGFLALTPTGDTGALARLAAKVVAGLDHHRAPAPPEEVARRRTSGLSPRQEAHLERWGYPYVMDEFRFHLTLTGRLSDDDSEAVRRALAPVLAPLLPRPFRLDELCLFGEDTDGMFHLLHRYALTG